MVHTSLHGHLKIYIQVDFIEYAEKFSIDMKILQFLPADSIFSSPFFDILHGCFWLLFP